MSNGENVTIYKVVIDREDHYSMWPVDRKIPSGWQEPGKTGTEKECLDYIHEVAPIKASAIKHNVTQGKT